MTIYLEDVYKTSGVPTYTFVEPSEYTRLKVALRTKGRGLVIEGPSGIGKTTSVKRALEHLNLEDNVTYLTSRKKADVKIVEALFEKENIGIVVIDDFHMLSNTNKKNLSDFMKTLADEESESSKLILIGINKAGDSLISFAPDLNNRLDTIKFEANPDEKVEEMITLGEKALNVKINIKDSIVEESKGSLHIAQMLSKDTCILSNITEEQTSEIITNTSMEIVKDNVIKDLRRVFFEHAKKFATGPRLRKEGRAPYLHLLKWLSESSEWSLPINEIINKYPEMRNSINQIVEKGYLVNHIEGSSDLKKVIHYDSQSNLLTIEDPKFLFYIQNINWNEFTQNIGFTSIRFSKPYDIALSFAGENRDLAALIYEKLVEREITTFYDKNEQHRILAENVEDYLRPIYQTEADYIVVLLSKDYPRKIWTKFESDQFKERFGDNAIIPVWYSDTDIGLFDETRKYGGLSFNTDNSIEEDSENIVKTLAKKLTTIRNEGC